jgi:hypothetical protein
MALQESGRGRVQVVDVAAASPAFDAGVMKGDVIVSFASFQGESYRDWIEGMGRLVTDTPDGETIEVDLLRGGKRVAVTIRAPEAKADDPRLPGLRNPQQDIQTAPGQIGGALPHLSQPLMNGQGSDIFLDNAPFSQAFNAGNASVNDRAMAEIVRLSPQPQAAPGINVDAGIDAQSPAASAAASASQRPNEPDATTNATPRIGVAGFRNDANGLLVMIDIAGLEPGSYHVGIDDPGIVVGSGHATQNQTSPAATGAPGGAPRSSIRGTAQSSSTDPAGTPVDGRTDQSSIPPSGQARPLSAPPAGQVRPLSTPPSGQARPLTSTPTGLLDTRQPGRADMPMGETAPTGTLSQIGILTVDQSGTGRFQQVVEGVQVSDILGQAIVLYAPAVTPQTAIPPSQNVSGLREGAGDQNVPVRPQGAASTASTEVPGAALPQAGGEAQANNSTPPVAAGVIRLLSDRRPAITKSGLPGGDPTSNPQAQVPGQATESQPTERAQLPQPAVR